MSAELDRHPHAKAILAPVFSDTSTASHAYLFHGPGGAGKRSVARAIAAELLAVGVEDEASARERVMSGAHTDLTWVVPSGAHEMLVGDIDQPVVAAASKTPFESTRRVFVIEGVDRLGDEAANRMLKTLEEPAPFVHLILLTDRLVDVLPTIRSRCQVVRFDARPAAEVARRLVAAGVPEDRALACAGLSLGDARGADELVTAEGSALREAAEGFARAAIAGESADAKAWTPLLQSAQARGELARAEEIGRGEAELQLYPKKEHRRITTEWEERARRSRRRAETTALDLALQLVSLWLADLAHLGWGAEDLIRNVDRLDALRELAGIEPRRLCNAIESVEETRRRFVLNVTEELACEALAYRLEHALAA